MTQQRPTPGSPSSDGRIDARRQALQAVDISSTTTHPGLWFDRYLDHQWQKGRPFGTNVESPLAAHVVKTTHVGNMLQSRQVSQFGNNYQHWYQRWEQSCKDANARTRMAQATGRLILGLGGESVIETGIAIHHTYGVPYLPGSALKGLAAHYARNSLNAAWGTWQTSKGKPQFMPADAYITMFGGLEAAGYVTFFDALPQPSSAIDGRFLHADVLTVHHPDYYANKAAPPADWDSPNPVSFLSATGNYCIPIAGPPQWRDRAFEILRRALAELGIGAKTSSGYGRMELSLS